MSFAKARAMPKETGPRLVYDAATDLTRKALVTRHWPMQRISRFAAATAPAMLVLVSGLDATACEAGDEADDKSGGRRSPY